MYEAKAEDENVACVPIGRPISNAQTYVLDKFLALVPVGVSGELYIGGAGLARGYLRRPDLTAEKFVPNPFGNFDERLYRTGDLARYRQDGNIEYLGRLDHQLKIRGFRVELGEVEAVLARLGSVREAVALAREDTPGAARIVAYLVCEAGAELSIGELRASLSNDLPDYMILSSFVFLDALPLTPNGKADRKALPAPGAAVGAKDYVAPRTPIEEKLCLIWASVIGLERVGVNDNFFELGGHSLLGMTLIERMRREGLPSDVRSLFANPTPGALSSVLDQGDRIEVPPNLIPHDCVFITPEALSLADMAQAEIDRVVTSVPGGASNVQDIYPLTPLQQGILFHHFISDRGDPYVMPSTLAFDTRARLEAFCKALRAVIARHDILRTAVLWEGLRDPIQVVWREAPLHVEEVAIDATKGDVAQKLQSRFNPREFRIDVRKAPMLQIFWAQDAVNHRIVLQLFVHHIVLDRAAGEALLDEMAAHLSGRANDLPASPPFRDFVARTRLRASAWKHEPFFSKMLGDVTEPTAPFGMLDVRGDGSNVKEQRLQLNLALSSRVRSAARSLKVSVASIWHMAFAHVLAGVSSRSDVVFGTVLFGRMHGSAATAQTVGMFFNTLPIRVRVGAESVVEAARSLHDALIALIAQEHAPR